MGTSRSRTRRAGQPPAAGPAPGRRSAGRPLLVVGALALIAAAALAIGWPRTRAFALGVDPDQNVLLVTIDTLRADALGSYGGAAATPHLDRLAAGGARFTFAHAHAVVTLPSHTTILTGQLPYEHGMRDNSGYRVKAGTATLATRLKAAGFATGAFVGGFPLTKRFGLTPGFDVYDDQVPEMKGDVAFSMPERRADVVVSRAVEWIDRQDGRFFAWVHVFDPHAPYEPPAEYLAAYPGRPYDGEVAWVDRALGPLFDRLAARPRPTLVIVTSDHGESLGEHGEMTHGMFAYEATLRVPLIVARVHPGARETRRGLVIDAPVRHVDIAPTVLESLGMGPDGAWAGSPLRPAIDSRAAGDRPAYFESMTYNLVRGWAPLRGVLVERRKYIDQPIPELYDLAADPAETDNRAAAERDTLQVMGHVLRGYDVAPPARPGRESADVAATLRSLGYISGHAPARRTYTEADDLKTLVAVDRDLHEATRLYQQGRTGEAIAGFERVIERRPDTADAYISLAHAFWESGQPRPAIATLERALTSGAPDRDVRIRLGIYLAESGGDTARAVQLLESLPDTDVEALNGLGVAYTNARRFDEAAAAFERVLALDPTNGLAYQNLASIALARAQAARAGRERQAGLDEAERLANLALQADPALAKACTTLGVVLSETGRRAEAIDAWKRAVELDPAELDALYNLAIVLAGAGRLEEARGYARQFVATAPAALYGPAVEQVRKLLEDGEGSLPPPGRW